jgi:hypothetical protein
LYLAQKMAVLRNNRLDPQSFQMGSDDSVSQPAAQALILLDQKRINFVPPYVNALRVTVQKSEDLVHLLVAQIGLKFPQDLPRYFDSKPIQGV